MGERPVEAAGDPAADTEPPQLALPPGSPGPRRPTGALAGWRVNWWGFVPLSAIALLAFVGFRALGVGGDDAGDDAALAAAPSASVTRTTRLSAASTTVAGTAPTTTIAAPVTTPPPTTAPPGPAVQAWGEIKPCRFGDACLAVSFTVSGFPDPVPTTFRCVYPNSTREFSFQDGGKVDACLTGDEGDVVYIEVAGVRSGPVSADNLNP